MIIIDAYYSLTRTKWLIMGIMNNISTMTIPVISLDDSKHFANLGGILHQQNVVVSSFELDSHPFFIVLSCTVISRVVEISIFSNGWLESDTNVSSIIYQQDSLANKYNYKLNLFINWHHKQVWQVCVHTKYAFIVFPHVFQ